MAGNANSGGAKAKPFRDALRMEIAAAGADGKALRTVARSLLNQAMAGEQWAVRELADRIDGKVAQAIIGGDDDDPPVKITRIEIVAAGGNGPG